MKCVLDIRLAFLELDDDVFESGGAVSPNFLNPESLVERAMVRHACLFR